jgi:heme/copper-type cytochrome/quinol oxidase subunit 4
MTKNNSAKFAFYYMLSLVTLIIVSMGAGSIIFEIINRVFPDEILGNFNSKITWSFSSILIATPIFYFINNKIYRGLKNKEIELESDIRKWFSYFIIFVSSVLVIISLINVISDFLEGGLTTNSALKIITVLFISGLIFSFYFFDIKRKTLEGRLNKVYFWISLVFVLVVFVGSFFYMDSPQEARNKKIDQDTLQHFGQLSYEVENYYNKHNELPQYLSVDKYEYHDIDMSKYEYNIINEDTYEICAEFLTSNLDSEETFYDREWKHDKDYQCIRKTVNLIKY